MLSLIYQMLLGIVLSTQRLKVMDTSNWIVKGSIGVIIIAFCVWINILV